MNLKINRFIKNNNFDSKDKPTTTSTTPFNKMIVISQLIVLGVQWVYDKTVRLVKIQTSDLSLDDRKRIMREGSSVDDISISSSTSVSKPRKGSRGKLTPPTVPSTSVDDSRI